MPEGRESWRSFVDSADIQPLGTSYGYQLELPFTEPSYRSQRLSSFFDDPRNLRGLLGNITFDEAGNRVDDSTAFQNASRVKRDIRGNPKLVQDLSSSLADIGALEDAYSLRQLFGEAPGAYGSRSHLENTSSLLSRGLPDAATGERYRMSIGGGDLTSELSPFERTAQTAVNLRPDILSADIEFLQRPDVVSKFALQSGVDLSNDALVEVGRRLNQRFDPSALNAPIDVDIPGDYDNEYFRRLINRNDLGVTEIGSGTSAMFPGEFAERLERLQNDPRFDSDYVYNYLRYNRGLPDDAYDTEAEALRQEKNSNADYEGRSASEVYRFAGEYPEVSRVLEGYAQGSRISKDDLNKYYSDYIPESYEKLPFGFKEGLEEGLRAIAPSNRDIEARLDSFSRNARSEGLPGALLRLANNRLDIQNQAVDKRATEFIKSYIRDAKERLIDVPTRTAGVGGGEYMQRGGSYDKALDKLDFFEQPYIPDDFEPTVSATFYSDEGKPYEVTINRDPNSQSLTPVNMNESVLKMLEDKPYAGVYGIDFTVNGSYGDVDAPPEVKPRIMNFVTENFRQGLPLGAVVYNKPLGNEATRNKKEAGNKRSLWYQKMGFGSDTPMGQYGYIDPDTGNTVPIQPYRTALEQGRDAYKRSYFSLDPVVAAAIGLQELGQGIRRTPSALLPGAADLIPSPEAIRTGYQKGPVEMGKQMGVEFVQSLPTAAASAAVLGTPAAAPFAPGIGAGFVGTAAARALNEVVRQETGEGIVPKLRQAVGTAPRTGVASPQRVGPVVTPQIRPLNQAQRAEMERRQNRNELQKRVDLVRERFNPAKGEFGISELLFGR